jgi:hypothetical protein
MTTLFEHSANCSPLVPCGACEIVAWLRGKLSAEDFSELVERIHNLDEPKKRNYRRRKPASAEADLLETQSDQRTA